MNVLRTIDGDMTINQTIQERPGTVGTFHRLGLDACCGGSLTIRVAAERHGLDPAAVLRELNDDATG
jgi:iron-sulfur cluster repair protein YtfE (RIC family)